MGWYRAGSRFGFPESVWVGHRPSPLHLPGPTTVSQIASSRESTKGFWVSYPYAAWVAWRKPPAARTGMPNGDSE